MTAEKDAAYASVAVPVPVRRLFTYAVREAAREELHVGARVRVPFGNRRVTATVVEWPTDPPEPGVEVKWVEACLRGAPTLPDDVLALTRFVSDYYLCSWGEAIETALPPGARAPRARPGLRRLPVADLEGLSGRAEAQRRLLERLPADGTIVPLDRLDASARRAARALIDRAWIERADVVPGKVSGTPAHGPLRLGEVPPDPTPPQAEVLAELEEALGAGEYRPHLLFGATGSGKTEVYLRAAESTMRRGRSVLYLVPEIGLTPLLLALVARRFPGEAAVLHSNLPSGRRYEEWERIRSGRRRFVLGTRSAVFAPLRDLGLIVVDEEQDSSYKQGESPRYNGRDLAVVRAHRSGAALVLGSATPSMESFRHARAGQYRLLRLGGRVLNRPLPTVTRVDMRREFLQHGRVTPLSAPLVEALREVVEQREQALVLRNRRGWAAAIACMRCGQRVTCDRCSIGMTWHQAEARLKCHYCSQERPFPEECPVCRGDQMKMLGEGTEKLEDLVREALPGARIERMDRDSMRRRGAQERLLRRFQAGEIDVLVGTQMIAKGHDFPRVTLVGVISADQALGMPDFRAGERAFQLLTQVAGRAGRGERPGRVIVQAFDPDHPVLVLAGEQDYEEFYEREIRYRQVLHYPPVTALVQVLVHDRDEFQAREWASLVADALRESGGGRLMMLGPGPAPLSRVRGQFRQQILVRTAGRRRLVGAVDRALADVEGRVPRRAIQVDVDPLSIL